MTLETDRSLLAARATPAVRMGLCTIAPSLFITYAEIGHAAGISKSAAYTLAVYGYWPRRKDPAVLKQRIQALFVERGATAAELRALFEPVGSAQSRELTAARRTRAAESRATATTCEVDVLISKQVMTPATGRHFKLFRNPFDGPVERDEQLFMSDELAFVRDVLWQCATSASFMALIGESGAGKTTLLHDLEDRLQKDPRGVVLIKPSTLGMEESERLGHQLKTHDLLHAIITTLNAGVTIPSGNQARTLLAMRLLAASTRAGYSHVLAVEEAHGMPEATLRHLKRLHEVREGRRGLLGIMLLGQPELRRRLHDGLRSGVLREVAQRCEVVDMPPLGKHLRAYLECRAAACGRGLDTIAEPAAVEAIADKLTARVGQRAVPMSYPLAANNVITRAMNLAADVGAPVVTANVVKGI